MATSKINMRSRLRSTVETAFYGNNVTNIDSIQQAYTLAKSSAGTIVTDMPVHRPLEMGLPEDAKVLLFNDGAVTGRCAQARVIMDESMGACDETLMSKVREAVYHTRNKNLLHAEVVVGLHESFSVKAHLLIPAGHENILYNWMMNFQVITDTVKSMYAQSHKYENESDIYIFSDPDWTDSEHPLGLTLFDSSSNSAALLGMRYFGEHKKGTLTLAWNIANRNGFISCHGGQKRFITKDGRKYVASIFGLSGSGKSTLTHCKHDGQYDVKILHDDAFVISTENGSSVALEPSYFDKTQDYPAGHPDNKFLVTAQNCGAMRDENGNVVLCTEDIRNGNGRAIKSKFWAENRVDYFGASVNAVIWLMKDPAMPPVLKINDPVLAATMGATLATKRSSAERIAKASERNALVIEPYANPFRVYPLEQDFEKFRGVFENGKVECYILNTGHFGEKKITKEVTLSIFEKIVDGQADFKAWGPFETIETLHIEGFTADWKNPVYVETVRKAFEYRLNYIEKGLQNKGLDTLPEVTRDVIQAHCNKLLSMIHMNRTA